MRSFMAAYDLIQAKLHLYWERTWQIILRDSGFHETNDEHRQ